MAIRYYKRNEQVSKYGGDLRVTGETRTLGRARIAAEAMENRIKEGRNLRTGRPKK